MKIKKSQEEMVGFALIVIVVTLISLFLLSFYIRKPGKIYNDNSISSFLHASMLHTSDCTPMTRPALIYNIKDLIKSCGKGTGERCSNNKLTCEVLRENLQDLLEKSWIISEKSKYTSYALTIIEKGTGRPVIPPIIKQTPEVALGVGNKYTSGIMIPDGGYIVNLTFYSST